MYGRASELDTNLSEVLSRFFIFERIRQLVQTEGAIDHRPQSDRFDGTNQFMLLTAISNDQSLQPYLFHHHRRRRYFAAESGERANQGNVPANARGLDRLRERTGTAEFDDMIDTAPAGPAAHQVAPLRHRLVVDRVVRAERAGLLEFFIRGGRYDHLGAHQLDQLKREDRNAARAKREHSVAWLELCIADQC